MSAKTHPKTRAARIQEIDQRVQSRLPDRSPITDRVNTQPPHNAVCLANNNQGTRFDCFGMPRPSYREEVLTNRTRTRFWYSRGAAGYMSSYDSTTSKRKATAWCVLVRRRAKLYKMAMPHLMSAG